ncbi:MAG: pyridoxal phosphate-dependent aminotransferase [Candidatus Bathyarchaeota archaeon]|nr:pyridoxal phosphate-dependent aminotransferase [Candidatus Bathyarchaeota archaeon]
MSSFAENVDEKVTLENMMQKRGSQKWNTYDPDVIPLYFCSPDYPVPTEVKDAASKAINDECFEYPWFPETVEAMAETTRTKYGIESTAEDLMVVPGVMPSLWLSTMYACKPGDEVILPSMIFGPFIRAIDYVNAKPVYHELRQEENWRFDIERLKELITKKTKLIFVCNPHNPTGRVMTKEELKGIADIAVDHDLIVASDELHADIIYDGRKHISIASLGPEIADKTISIYGLSKTFGLAGMQIGWLVATNKVILEGINKVAGDLIQGTTSISLAIAHAVLTKCDHYIPPLVEYLQELRDYGTKRLNTMNNVEVGSPEGTYVLWPNISGYGLSSSEMSEYLLKTGRVATTDGSRHGPTGEGYLRVIFPTSKTIFNEGLDRMEEALSKL